MRPEVISSLVHCGHSGGIKRLKKYHLKISEIVTLQFSLFVFFLPGKATFDFNEYRQASTLFRCILFSFTIYF